MVLQRQNALSHFINILRATDAITCKILKLSENDPYMYKIVHKAIVRYNKETICNFEQKSKLFRRVRTKFHI